MKELWIEDFLKKTNKNKFEVLIVAAYRASEIYVGKSPVLESDGIHKAPILALKEISEQLVDYDVLKERLACKLVGVDSLLAF